MEWAEDRKIYLTSDGLYAKIFLPDHHKLALDRVLSRQT
jgi:hypothetical protein